MDAWRHHVSRSRTVHIKTILRQTFANDVTVGDHPDQSIILANWDGADVVRAHQFSEFGDRGVRADPLDPLVHCFFDFHADLLCGFGCTYDEYAAPPQPQVLIPSARARMRKMRHSLSALLCSFESYFRQS